MIVGYNCFAQKKRRELLDIEAIERSPGRKVDSLLREWVMLSRSKNLGAHGGITQVRATPCSRERVETDRTGVLGGRWLRCLAEVRVDMRELSLRREVDPTPYVIEALEQSAAETNAILHMTC
jgi:hypothetical protein